MVVVLRDQPGSTPCALPVMIAVRIAIKYRCTRLPRLKFCMQSTTQYLLQSDVDISLLGTALVVDEEARTPRLVLLGSLLLAFRWEGGFYHEEGVGV